MANTKSWLRRRGGKLKGWLAVSAGPRFGYRGILPRVLERRAITRLWDEMAPWIHSRWGRRPYDPKLPDLIRRYRVASVLDVGCGTGWLFPMYRDLGLDDVVGMDISEVALAIARKDYPAVRTVCCRFEDMDFPAQRFDIAISESSLQHVPKHGINWQAGGLSPACVCEGADRLE